MAHLWNNVRTARVRLHQVILRQCHLMSSTSASSPLDGHEDFLATQRSESEAYILYLALEIAATVPQLSEHLELVQIKPERAEVSRQLLASETLPEAELVPPDSPKRVHPFFVHDPRLRAESADRPRRLSRIPIFNMAREHSEIKVDAPASFKKDPHSASIYHMLYQLYNLHSITILPAEFKTWIRTRIRWMETQTEGQDLMDLQDLVLRRPYDGFLIDDEG
jgi:hypothetical protein